MPSSEGLRWRALGAPVPGVAATRGVPSRFDMRTHKLAAYDALVEQIVTLELPPGARLVESTISAQLGISKTPVREAIALLEANGLVDTTPYRGATIRWLSLNESLEQGYLVDALEMPAYPIVIERITRSELAAVGRVVEHLKRARRTGDRLLYATLAVEIHVRLFAPTGYPRLLALIQNVLDPVGRRYDHATVYPFDDAWDGLRDMAVARYEALRTRDLDTVVRTIEEHRSRLREMTRRKAALPEVARYFRPG